MKEKEPKVNSGAKYFHPGIIEVSGDDEEDEAEELDAQEYPTLDELKVMIKTTPRRKMAKIGKTPQQEKKEMAKAVDMMEAKYRNVDIDYVESGNEWFELPDGGLTIDSGAAESVMPEDMCSNYATKESSQGKAGVYYVTASGEELENGGESRLTMTLSDGRQMEHTFQRTNVNKPLGAVSRICQAGQQVVFNPEGHPDGSYIRNLATGGRAQCELFRLCCVRLLACVL